MSYAGDLNPKDAWAFLAEHADAALVDVRTQAEWSFVGVPRTDEIDRPTLLIEWNTFPNGSRNPAFLDQLRQAGYEAGDGKPLVFICRSGQRSIAAAEAATAAGYGPAYNVSDGFEGPTDTEGHRGQVGWRADGLPWTQS
ncbi:rhodanese-like domain-containing protein [Ruania alkalisoli]|uniref:Rhodanese-like domain-containing protein n=1 Tax=Ruania alkalisoli TaxID=2779775 RepID=A0A7M1SUW1_9MICO|nr:MULTISPECIES: rhodanese-like domain-containing protein [Ruania]QOR71271.1 rhodanese-like domain-containing protein [Ruania alkalisoli]